MSGVEEAVFGTAMFGLGAIAGCFITKKMLEESY